MKIVYHVVDRDRQLVRVPSEVMERYWNHSGGTPEVSQLVDDQLQLVTSLLDDRLNPIINYMLDLELNEGWISPESKLQAYQSLSLQRNEAKFEELQAILERWPADWPTQLAVALDVPVMGLNKIGLGGPLPMCDLWGITQEKLLEFFEKVCDKD
ncbi:hypothetical protein Pla110_23110 [Polystyrenella longa]|uniref:Uncharacterized protein n=1 Tax=Polystyrenella longa TaxID=2528007 RepID=A0A518CMY2_9PLAN|nr:hypothetical protein [Polystyrenella longa]QDU80580.1 hypothetical protein Pla110_23110 [Polystyrenella longa]